MIYIADPSQQPTFDPIFKSDALNRELQDDDDNDFLCLIVIHWYFFNGETRVVEYNYKPLTPFHMTNESLEESIRELIKFHLGITNVYFDCEGNLIDKL